MGIEMSIRGKAGTAFVAVALSVAAASASAQYAPSRSVSLSAGAMSFDVSGTGTAPTFALRMDTELGRRWLVGDLGLGYASIEEQSAIDRTQLGILEGQLQLQLPGAYLRPYVGAGAGLISYLTQAGGRHEVSGSLSVGAGLRAPLADRVGLRVDGRLRAWDDRSAGFGFVNSTSELTAGLSVRF
jgi:hypothetical protein